MFYLPYVKTENHLHVQSQLSLNEYTARSTMLGKEGKS